MAVWSAALFSDDEPSAMLVAVSASCRSSSRNRSEKSQT